MRELELKSIARMGMSREELELRKYAAAEFGGHPRCLLTEIVKRRTRSRSKNLATEKDSRDGVPSSSPAQA